MAVSNSDGANPDVGLTISGNTLYGVTMEGGTNATGTIFAVNTNGLGFKTIYTFSAGLPNYPNDGSTAYNNDGAFPYARLTVSGNKLYGTASSGGTNGNGTIFVVNTNGTGFTVLHTFSSRDPATLTTNVDGAFPGTGLTLSGDSLYGTAFSGGANGSGTIFAINTNGMGFRTLYAFSAETANAAGIYTNSDGAGTAPDASLTLLGDTLYGGALGGGTNGNGTIFAINTNGTTFRVLHTFSATNTYIAYQFGTNGDGASPQGALVLSGSTLYGSTVWGGTNGNGTVFGINTNGTGFSVLHAFTVGYSNSDGANPEAGLV